MESILIVLASASAVMAGVSVGAALYCGSTARPGERQQLMERMQNLEGAMPTVLQQLETYVDAAGADLTEAKRQRQRAQNTQNRDGATNGPVAPTTRAQQLEVVKARYGNQL